MNHLNYFWANLGSSVPVYTEYIQERDYNFYKSKNMIELLTNILLFASFEFDVIFSNDMLKHEWSDTILIKLL